MDHDPDERGTEEDPMTDVVPIPTTTAARRRRTAARVAALATGAGLLVAVPGAAWAAVPSRPPVTSRPVGPPPHVHPGRVTSALLVRTEPTSPAVTWSSLPGSTSLTL